MLAAIAGAGIMGERLSGGNVAIALLANTVATGAMLVAPILTFGPISGAHFNPAVTLADAWQHGVAWRHVRSGSAHFICEPRSDLGSFRDGHVATAVMEEIGIDISGHRSKPIDEFAGQEFTSVTVVCDNASESCPVFPSETERLHWPFEDPAAIQGSDDERKAAFRKVRDQIHGRILMFSGEAASAGKACCQTGGG